jgi:L-ribulose-5-phosphate 3-epimerase UlaE
MLTEFRLDSWWLIRLISASRMGFDFIEFKQSDDRLSRNPDL